MQIKINTAYYAKAGETPDADVSEKARHLIIFDNGPYAEAACGIGLTKRSKVASVGLAGVLIKCRYDYQTPICKNCIKVAHAMIKQHLCDVYRLVNLLTEQVLDDINIEIDCADAMSGEALELVSCQGQERSLVYIYAGTMQKATKKQFLSNI